MNCVLKNTDVMMNTATIIMAAPAIVKAARSIIDMIVAVSAKENMDAIVLPLANHA